MDLGDVLGKIAAGIALCVLSLPPVAAAAEAVCNAKRASVQLLPKERNAGTVNVFASREIMVDSGFSGGVVRPTPSGYVLAWVSAAPGSKESRSRVATIAGGEIGPVFDLSHDGESAAGVDIAVDGSRAMIAWQEGRTESSQVFVAELDLGAKTPRPEIREVTKKKAGLHDWVQTIVWDRCRFALAYLHGINASAVQLELLP